MKLCPICKTKTVDDDARYCTECGSSFDGKVVRKTSALVPKTVSAPDSKMLNIGKGYKVELSKDRQVLNRLLVDIKWQSEPGFDIDAAVFLLNKNGKVDNEIDFVFYNNPQHQSAGATHSRIDGNHEQIALELKKLPINVKKLAFTLTIDEAKLRHQSFDKVNSIEINIINGSSNQKLIRYALNNDFSSETAIVLGEIYRNKARWKFHAVGAGFNGGLAALCNNFGIEIN